MDRNHIETLTAISAECGAIAEASHHAVRSILRIADLANGLQVSIAAILAQSIVDGEVSLNDVREALVKSPLAQEGGATVTAEGLGCSAAGVGNGSADYSGPAQAGRRSDHAAEAEQALTEGDTGSPPSNPEPVSPPESGEHPETDKVAEIMGRTQSVRSTVIELYHETGIAVEAIAIVCGTDLRTVETWLRNARNNADARVLRGDEARGIEVESV